MTVRLIRAAVLVILVLLAFALAAPYARIEGLGEPLRAALEEALNRRVDIGGGVHPRILPRPGLSVESVVIHEDPEIGLEPIAYVDSLEAGLSPAALLGGRLEVTALRLVRPSVNLTKGKTGTWNYPSLLQRAFSGEPRSNRPPLPRIEVRDARLNFKFGALKSVFYLSGADVDVTPVAGEEPAVQFRFAGSPSRTDRAAQGFGALSGNGLFVYSREGENRIRLVIRLERSAIPDLLTLVKGHGAGLGGFLASRAVLEGPLSHVRIEGEMQLADVDRRFLLPGRSGEWSLDYVGDLDLVRRRVRIETRPRKERLPISIRVFLSDYLTAPRWAAVLSAESLPLEMLTALAVELGNPLLPGLSLRGTLSGAAGRAPDGTMQGSFRASDIELGAPDRATLHVDQAEITAGAGVVRVLPTQVSIDQREVAEVSGSYARSPARLELAVRARGLSVARFREVWPAMTGGSLPPAMEIWRAGDWSGDLRYTRGGDEEGWRGHLRIRETALSDPALAGPAEIDQIETDVSGRRATLEGAAGGVPFRASVQPGKPLTLAIPELDAAVLEELLAPALRWRRPSLLARTLRLRGQPTPAWLARRNLDARISVETLRAGPASLTDLVCRLYWRGPHVEIHLDRAAANAGEARGRLDVDLTSGSSPRYRLAGWVNGVRWNGATLQAAGRLVASGTGFELITGASGDGDFALRFAEPAGDFDRIEGCFELAAARGMPELSFPCLTLRSPVGTYYGSGRLSPAGEARMELFNESGRFAASGHWNALRLAARPAAAAELK